MVNLDIIILTLFSVSDVDGDVIRCRWAQGNDECASVCDGIPNADLNQVRLTRLSRSIIVHLSQLLQRYKQ